MIELEQFSEGLGVLALQCRHPLKSAEIDAFHVVLVDETDAREWVAFVRVAVKRFGWRLLPSAVELLDALRQFRDGAGLAGEAAKAYERVLAASVYTAEAGAVWSVRNVVAAAGKAAADAFLAAGGHHAFSTTWDESRRRERFLAAYVEAARERPASRLLPAPAEPRLLGPAPAPELTATEAREIVQQIAEHVPAVTVAPRPPMTPAEWDARIEQLRRQAAQITAQEEQPAGGPTCSAGGTPTCSAR